MTGFQFRRAEALAGIVLWCSMQGHASQAHIWHTSFILPAPPSAISASSSRLGLPVHVLCHVLSKCAFNFQDELLWSLPRKPAARVPGNGLNARFAPCSSLRAISRHTLLSNLAALQCENTVPMVPGNTDTCEVDSLLLVPGYLIVGFHIGPAKEGFQSSQAGEGVLKVYNMANASEDILAGHQVQQTSSFVNHLRLTTSMLKGCCQSWSRVAQLLPRSTQKAKDVNTTEWGG